MRPRAGFGSIEPGIESILWDGKGLAVVSRLDRAEPFESHLNARAARWCGLAESFSHPYYPAASFATLVPGTGAENLRGRF